MRLANISRNNQEPRGRAKRWRNAAQRKGCCAGFLALIGMMGLFGCGGTPPGFGRGGGGTGGSPGVVVVTVQPANASLFLGQAQQFQAIVSGTSNTSVTWSVNGVPGGNATFGTISNAGLYEAPSVLPAIASVTVTATSVADSQASSSASVMLTDDISVTVAPATATVSTGGAQVFTATVTGSGSTNTTVTWSVNGIAGGNATLGTIVANGNGGATYTAPGVIPSLATVTVMATSVADPTKAGSATVTITCGANSLLPTNVTLSLGQTQTFTASFCTVSGGTILWDVNGVAGGNLTFGTIVSGGGATATYTAPADLPSPTSLTIHATEGTAVVSSTVTIASGVTVNVAPANASVAVTQRATFTAIVGDTPDTAVTWTVNGIVNGNPSVGEICVTGSNPCVAPNGPVSGPVDYLAPATVPNANPVNVLATSKADPSQSGTAVVTITGPVGPISVTVSPAYAFVGAAGGQSSSAQFFASVANTADTAVTWSVQSAVTGQGCAGAACGSVDANGVYSAPAVAPSPNTISVVATSVADTTKSGSATIAITSGPTIETILPSSVMAGAVEGFPFEVQGANFVMGSGSTASVILLNGTTRATTCASTMACTTELNPADVQASATLTVQVQNPGTPGALSNPVPFVIVPFDVSVGTIALTQSAAEAMNEDIVVTDPTTAAASTPINVDFIGFLTGGNNCGVQGSPLTVTRPASGSQVVSLCVHGNGLDPTFTFSFSGPSGGGDIGVAASAIQGLFSNMIELDLTISSTTWPGVRTLFITTLNNDRAVATGMLEVK